MLDAYSQLRRRELIFCDLPSKIMYNKCYFPGYGKNLNSFDSIHFFTFKHIVCFGKGDIINV